MLGPFAERERLIVDFYDVPLNKYSTIFENRVSDKDWGLASYTAWSGRLVSRGVHQQRSACLRHRSTPVLL